MEEDQQILEFVNELFDVSDVDALKAIRPMNLYPLANKLQRGQEAVGDRWSTRILPIILSHLYCASETPWKQNFLKYVIDCRVTTLNDMDWKCVLQKWPFQTKATLMTVLCNVLSESKVKNVPLYQQILDYNSTLRQGRIVRKDIRERRDAIIARFDVMRKEKLAALS